MPGTESKPKLSTEDVCRTYYETQVFGPAAVAFFDAAHTRLQAQAVSFQGIDRNTFFNEIAAANLELFGLEWLQHVGEYGPGVPNAVILEEIRFTKRFLQNSGRAATWETISVFNGALQETFVKRGVWPDLGRPRDVASMITDEAL